MKWTPFIIVGVLLVLFFLLFLLFFFRPDGDESVIYL